MAALLAVNFIGTLGYSIVMPFLVFLVYRMGGNEVIYGVLGATYSAFQLVGAPILGRMSDSVGRRKILLLSQAGTLLAWFVFMAALLIPKTGGEFSIPLLGTFTLSFPLVLLFLGRALDGLTGGNISVANAYLVDISTEETKTANFGRMAASSNLGFIIGPAIAGVLGGTALGEILPVTAAILISVLGLILIFFTLKETNPVKLKKSPCKNPMRKVMGKEMKDCFDKKSSKYAFTDLIAITGVKPMLVLYFLIFLAFSLFYTAFPVYAADGLNWSMTQLGIFFSFLSGVMIFVQGPVNGMLSKKVCPEKLVLFGSLFMFLSFSMFMSAHTILVYIGAMLFSLGNGIMWPSFLTILSRFGSKEQQGSLQGISTSSGSMASILGLISGGLLYKAIGADTFLVAAIVFIFVCIGCLVTFGWKGKVVLVPH